MSKRILFFASILLTLATILTPYVYAQSQEERLQELEKEQAELEQKIADAHRNINTLSGQISYMDNQIRLTQIKIAQTQRNINQLEDDINVLSKKIVRVEDSLSLLQQTLLQRVRATYALGKPTPARLFLSGGGFEDALTSYHYLEILQRNDVKLLSQMQSTRVNYGDQRTSLEDRQAKLKAAKEELDKQNNLLAQQKGDKEKLLQATRNDEKRYQQLLAQAKSEARAIEEAIANSANLKNGVHVEKGDIIALMGNSGAPSCSTGAHLHFEVRINGGRVDPASYLRSGVAGFDNSPDGEIGFSGSSDWPMADPSVTQGYGMTYWARTGFYGGGPHTGIDMVSRASSAIRAVSSGTLYKATTTCGSSTLKYAVLDHGNGTRTYYLHIQ